MFSISLALAQGIQDKKANAKNSKVTAYIEKIQQSKKSVDSLLEKHQELLRQDQDHMKRLDEKKLSVFNNKIFNAHENVRNLKDRELLKKIRKDIELVSEITSKSVIFHENFMQMGEKNSADSIARESEFINAMIKSKNVLSENQKYINSGQNYLENQYQVLRKKMGK